MVVLIETERSLDNGLRGERGERGVIERTDMGSTICELRSDNGSVERRDLIKYSYGIS